MFKRVENELDLAVFDGIWTTVWMEKGYELEYSAEALDRFVVVTDEGQGVGTSEIKSYDLHGSLINRVAPFHLHPKLIAAEGAVAEIDKIALLQSYRSKGLYLSSILSSAVFSAERRGMKYFVSLLEPVFLRALKITFKVPLERIGDRLYYKGDYVIPIIFDMEAMYSSKEQFEWLVYPPQNRIREQVDIR